MYEGSGGWAVPKERIGCGQDNCEDIGNRDNTIDTLGHYH